MSLGDSAAGLVVDGRVENAFEILDERAVAPDVEGLRPVTDGENGLVEVEGVLEQEFVDGGTRSVGGAACGNRLLAIAQGIDVEPAAGKQNALGIGEEFGDAVRTLVKGNDDRCCADRVEGGEIGRKGALVVVGISGSGLGDRNAQRHG